MKKKYLFIIIPIIIIIFSFIISIGYSSWIISEPISIQTSEISIEDVTFKDASYYEVTYDGEGHAPHIDNETIDYGLVYDYCEIKYYNKDGSTSGTSVNGIANAGDYVAEYYNKSNNLVTKLNFKINKAVLNVTIPEQYCYYSLNSTPDTSKFPVVKGITDDETIEGEWVLDEDILFSETRVLYDEGGEKNKHYSLFNYKFVHNNPNYEEITNVQVKLCYYSVAYLGSGSTSYYCSLNNALDAANSGNIKEVFVIPGLMENGSSGNLHAIQISESLTIKSGVSLILPYTGVDWEPNNDEELKNNLIDSNATNVSTYRKTMLKLINGEDIIVENGGKLLLGGEFKASGICRNYCEINLDEGSSIQVYGEFYCYGYVKENSITAKNSYNTLYKDIHNNSYDEGREIVVYNNATITTAFSSNDLPNKGGGELSTLIGNNICPINIFDFPNIQTYLEIKVGGKLNARANMEVTGISFNKDVLVIGNSTSDALFKLTSGSIGIQYNPENVLYTNKDNAFTSLYLFGEVTQGYLNIEVGGGYDIVTKNNYLPISYKLRIFLGKNSVYSTNYMLKFLPGSELYIDNGATFNVYNSIIFYKTSTLNFTSEIKYSSGKANSRLINNGLINIGSNGSIGGLIETTNTEGTAQISFDSPSELALRSESPEGVHSLLNLTIISEGYFYDTGVQEPLIKQFIPAANIYSSTENIGCWEGESANQYYLDILIDKSNNYKYNVLGYQVFIYDDNNNEIELTPSTTEIEARYPIKQGQQFKVITIRNESATFLNSNDIEFTSGTKYTMNSDLSLQIVPSEGIKITYSSSSISGAGASSFTFWEAKDKNGTGEIELGTKSTNDEFIIAKNYYFKFKFNGPEGLAGMAISFSKAEITPAVESTTSISQNKYYQVTNPNNSSNSYSIFFTLKSGCITSDTLITLADGTQVRIDQLTGHELLRVWDHVSGTFINVPIGYLIKHNDNETLHTVTKLSFSNDNFVKIIGDHTFYNTTLNKYIIMNEYNAHLYVGDYFIYESDGKLEKVQLISADTFEEYTIAYSIETFGTITSFANGILSATPYLEAVLNAFDINSETFIYENMSEDINKYGVYSYDELSDLMTYEEYQMTNAKYFKVAIEKGIITWEEFMQAIEIFRSVEGDFIN